MGCGCKDNTTKGDIEVKDESSLLSKIFKGTMMGILMIILSPIILVMIWIISINSVVQGSYNPIMGLSNLLSRKNKYDEEVDEEINIEDYELVDAEVIK